MADPHRVAVDIFAGAGGLTLGARRAGLDVRIAVELNPDASATYRKHSPATHLLECDVRDVTGSQLLKLLPGGRVDLLMGCAPCQGFCSLTARSGHQDPRNQLISEMARLVEEVSPTALFMENVPGLALRGRILFESLLQRLRRAGYLPQWWNVQMANYGIPQLRRRLVLLAGRGFFIDLPQPTHARVPLESQGLQPWQTLRDALTPLPEPAPSLRLAWKHGGPRALNWHVVRDLQPQTRKRLQAATPGSMRFALDDGLLPECHRAGYTGFRNVYMRMQWDTPAPTITAGCTTPAKGRFGHPDPRRTTISVHEAALIQTFPKTFQIETDKIDVACSLVGNAVPPDFADVVIRHIAAQIPD